MCILEQIRLRYGATAYSFELTKLSNFKSSMLTKIIILLSDYLNCGSNSFRSNFILLSIISPTRPLVRPCALCIQRYSELHDACIVQSLTKGGQDKHKVNTFSIIYKFKKEFRHLKNSYILANLLGMTNKPQAHSLMKTINSNHVIYIYKEISRKFGEKNLEQAVSL